MLISELLSEQKLSPADQIRQDTELMTQHILKQRQQQQAQQPQQAPQAAPVATPAAPEKVVTPDMIAKHPQYKAWYDKYLAIELPRSTHRGAAEMQAKKYADGKITRLIQQGQ
jgi:hypothetical protein